MKALLEWTYEIESQQRLMLEALILPAPRSGESFFRWLSTVDFKAIDYVTMRLVPALLRKFGNVITDNNQRRSMESIYRYHHFRSSLVLGIGRRVLERMHNGGIEFVLFKGAAIAPKYHKNVVTRPMSDIDVLVRREDVAGVEEILQQHGFHYGYSPEKKRADSHSHDYIDANWSGFDVHWYSLYESTQTGIDDGIWSRAELFDWDGLVVKVMAPEDLLLTSIVNGVRDYPIRPHWIHDVATIADSEPIVLWNTVWEEAKRRDLREPVFHALDLVRRISDKTVPQTVLEGLLERDPEFRKSLQSSANPTDLAGQILYLSDGNHAVTKLRLRGRYLPLIPQLFEVSDRRKLDELISEHPSEGTVYLEPPLGLLAAKGKPELPAYNADITLVDFPPSPVVSPGAVVEITVQVENSSTHCWSVDWRSGKLFGVSCHLLSEDGKVLIWDTPRAYFMIARHNHVTFVEPSQVLTRTLKFIAPMKPGRYRVQLDIVQELVTWFSQHGNQFPCIDLEVVASVSGGRYELRGPEVVYETLGDRTAIIDLDRGSYYTTDGAASVIWKALVDGHAASTIIAAFATAANSQSEEKVVEGFINSLLREGLIKASHSSDMEPRGEFNVDGGLATQCPILVCHRGINELIRKHPVQAASEQLGWPYPKAVSDGADDGSAPA